MRRRTWIRPVQQLWSRWTAILREAFDLATGPLQSEAQGLGLSVDCNGDCIQVASVHHSTILTRLFKSFSALHLLVRFVGIGMSLAPRLSTLQKASKEVGVFVARAFVQAVYSTTLRSGTQFFYKCSMLYRVGTTLTLA